MSQVAIVTGAAGNLGNAVVKKLLDNGNTVVGTVLPGEHCKQGEGQAHFEEYKIDVTDGNAAGNFIRHVVHQYGKINFAALLVGGFSMGKIEDTTMEDIYKMMKLNFETAFITAQAIYSQMQQQSMGGHLMFVGAKPALEKAAGTSTLAYALSKSLIFKLAEYINESGKQHKIKASVIVPSILDTPTNRKAMPDANFQDWVKPEEAAEIVNFIFSEKSAPLQETVFKIYGNV